MKSDTFQPNAEQLAVIESEAMHILCIAGAGAGKTATVAARIRHMIANGVQASSIVAITYTNAAARELKDRIGQDLGFIGTLHSFILREIQEHHALLGLPSRVSVLDDEAREAVIEHLRESMRVRESQEELLTACADFSLAVPQPKGKTLSRVQCAAVEYHRTLKRNGVLDFDSILWQGTRLAGQLKESRWQHLFVDEVQDSSDVDMKIYNGFPFKTRFMVGDGDQSVFSFRGGNMHHILYLASAVPSVSLFLLESNYRCLNPIPQLAQKLIERNTHRFPKKSRAMNDGATVEVNASSNAAGELVCAVRIAQDCTAKGKTFAILCRTNAQCEQFSEFLTGAGLKVARRTNPVKPKDWRAVKLWLTLMQNPFNDFVAYQFLVEKLGVKNADAIRNRCALDRVSIKEGHFSTLAFQGESDISLHGFSEESRERVHDCARRLSAGGDWTLQDLVLELNREDESREEHADGVVCTTLHAAKGREWDAVMIAGCEEGFCPSLREGTDLEEERRLFYVAMTRARSWLILSWCRERPQNRGPNQRPGPPEPQQPSRFIQEAGL